MLAVTMVPHKSDLGSRTVSIEESRKMSRSQTDLKKCLGNHVDELRLKSYSCAWQKEIIVQGHLHITANHLCFYSSILGFETKTIINVMDIISIKKEKTAHLIPNAIVIATEERKYRFSMFASRNKSYNILQIVWENATSSRPLSEDLLLARIRLLKVKSRSTENSPLSSPNHPTRHPVLQLSRSTGHTDSDSSGTSSPILLSRTLTPPLPSHPHLPPPPPPPPLSTSSPHNSPSKIVGVAPRVVVTTTNDDEKQLRIGNQDYPDTSSSRDSLFVDAIDTGSKLSNSNSDRRLELLNLNSDSADTISDIGSCGDMNTSTSDTDSNTDIGPESRRNCRKNFPTYVNPNSSMFEEEEKGDGSELRKDSKLLKGQGSSVGVSSESVTTETRNAPSVVKELLGRIHNIHPTTIGLRRLQKGLTDWGTPSNFINLLILISIFLLLLSTASMLCRLSYVSPAFQPFIAWQPWCRLCSDCRSSARPHSPGGVSQERAARQQQGGAGGVWTLARFEELVKKHSTNANSAADDSNSNTIATANQQT